MFHHSCGLACPSSFYGIVRYEILPEIHQKQSIENVGLTLTTVQISHTRAESVTHFEI